MSKYTVKVPIDFKEHIPLYLKRRENELLDLKRLIQEEKYNEIYTIGHQWKGNAPSFGFNYLGELGEDIEIFSQEKNLPKLKSFISEVEDYLDNLTIEYE